MKISNTLWLASVIGALAWSCKNETNENPNPSTTQNFKVTIENISQDKDFFASGVFNTPVGDNMPGAAAPGKSYSFNFSAPVGSKLSFATMYVKSNDLFYSPDGAGIDLYDGSGNPNSGDITSMLDLWDGGTEVNEMPGTGPNQPMNQSGPNTGIDENGTVQKIQDVMDGFTYPTVAMAVKVTLIHMGDANFNLIIENLNSNNSPIAPGVWVIHTASNPLFQENTMDWMQGLEALAEDGNPAMLGDELQMNSGIATPFAPGVWATHASNRVLFENGKTDWGEGLEGLAEDGTTELITAVMAKAEVKKSGVFNTPVGASAPGPLLPGNSYEFSFKADKGDYLSFATMFVQSNDLFFAPGDMGLALWSGGNPVNGDVTGSILFWDAGTELNEYPGVGPNQPLRQAGPNTGPAENGNVRLVDDGFIYLDADQTIRVSISLQ